MPIQTNFQAAVQTLAELAAPTNPGYIAVKAACKLVDILSPANPRHHDIMSVLSQPAVDAATGADAEDDAADEDDPSTRGEEDEPP